MIKALAIVAVLSLAVFLVSGMLMALIYGNNGPMWTLVFFVPLVISLATGGTAFACWAWHIDDDREA